MEQKMILYTRQKKLKHQKTINSDDLTKEIIASLQNNHPYRILIFGISGSRKTNALPNLIKKSKMIIIIVF